MGSYALAANRLAPQPPGVPRHHAGLDPPYVRHLMAGRLLSTAADNNRQIHAKPLQIKHLAARLFSRTGQRREAGR
jgi:hypothetical protein